MKSYLPKFDQTAVFGPDAFTHVAAYADALARFHGLMALPQWQMDEAARDLCEKYGIAGVCFGLPTMPGEDGFEIRNPDAGFCVTPPWFIGGGNWYEYE